MAIFAVVSGAAFLVFGAAAAATDGRAPGLALGLGAFWLAMGVVYAPRDTSAVHTRGGALVLPESRRRTVATYAGSAVVGLGLASSVGVPKAYTVLVIWTVAIAVFMARGGLGGSLLVDPEGVTYDAWRRRRRATWDEMPGVALLRRDHLTVDGLGTVRTERLAVDPLVVFWVLRHYRQHPEHREELADERAVERVRRENLT